MSNKNIRKKNFTLTFSIPTVIFCYQYPNRSRGNQKTINCHHAYMVTSFCPEGAQPDGLHSHINYNRSSNSVE